ncbi:MULTISPECIES: hypothetical protein [Actinoalloteichus]|uniref:Uncharacterized protein n=1 Tax=Actinoalloteichus fjordicus TaxID=1612552 RepID=A0AAC9LGJ7_9PSEU|nr:MULTISPECIES: hypothetical protein [Actinoalloteichus]APU15970.1 hypothetical protein UA74_19725 [Actinoalloteichus fjordicus]APU22034.1 hypothetical protein UA75_20225 [Actinoalloteichus sp. GBA129-24]
MAVDVSIVVGWEEDFLFYDSGVEDEAYCHPLDEARDFLGISGDLLRELETWDATFQSILDRTDLDASGFSTPEAEHAWFERGKELAARMKRECPSVASVDYQADGSIPAGTCVF